MRDLINFLITPAYADTAVVSNDAAGGSPFSMMIMIVIFFLFFYFAMWRPQSKRAREQRELISSLAKGDEVMTTGGLLGKIHKITEQYVILAIHHSTDVTVQKSAIVGVLPKGTLKSLE